MKKSGLLIFLILFVSANQLSAQSLKTDKLNLNLEEGDSFTYMVESTKSYIMKPPQQDVILRKIVSRFQHSFSVEERKPGNKYLLKYKIDYKISENRGNSGVQITDSRFPRYSNHISPITDCYFNNVEYKVLFSPLENTMEIVNMEEINEGLMHYLEKRGVLVNSYMQEEFNLKPSDYSVLRGILFMNFYPRGGGISQTWTIDQITDESEVYTYLGENDKTIHILSAKVYPHHAEENGLTVGESMKVYKEIQIQKKTGLLQSAESATYLLPDSIRTDAIFQSRSELTDFRSSITLIDFSRSRERTIIAGKINNLSASKLCMVSSRSIVGTDLDYQYIDLDSEGRFSVSLDFTKAKKCQLYYLENYPVKGNQKIQLYIEPGDSIYMITESGSFNKSISFSGRGFRNSEFLNEFYYGKKYHRFLGADPGYYYGMIRRIYDQLKELDNSLPEMSKYLEDNKSGLSQGFYDYWKFSLLCLSIRNKILLEYNENETMGQDGFQLKKSIKTFPDTLSPMYKIQANVEEFNILVGVHSMSQYNYINRIYSGVYSIGFASSDNVSVSKLLYSGYPLYVEAARQMEMLLRRGSRGFYTQTPIYQDILRGCNNEEVRNYCIEHFKAYEHIQKGNDMPEIELIGMDGKKMNWRQVKNKVVVLMLYNEYTQEQMFCEELFTEFGENKKDVVVLRISPGISFADWKAFNERYSDMEFQMYYTGGESGFVDEFFFLPEIRGSKYLVIGKDGKIFTNTNRLSLKREIKNARKAETPPNEFVKTFLTRILPGILLGVILTFIITRMIYRRRLAKQSLEKKMAELEQKAIKAQLNPHFLFNCLNSIQNLIRTNRKKDADLYLSKFAILIRLVLKNSEKEEISIFEELKSLETYLDLEQMRFNFEYEIKADDEIDIFNVMIPPMLFHPVVENAILHGLDAKEGDKKLSIALHQSGDSIKVLIEDNGVGRDPNEVNKSDDNQRGLKLMESRFDVLRRSSHGEISFSITDKKDKEGNPAGTLVEILMPDER